jgi:hypothetical protein
MTMEKIRDLSLAGIDGMRHLVVGEPIIRAVSFSRDVVVDRTAYRFVVAVSMVGALEDEDQWIKILDHVLNLERSARITRRLADTRPLLGLGDGAWYDDDRGTVRTVMHGSREYVIKWKTGRESIESASDILSDAEHAEVIK